MADPSSLALVAVIVGPGIAAVRAIDVGHIVDRRRVRLVGVPTAIGVPLCAVYKPDTCQPETSRLAGPRSSGTGRPSPNGRSTE